MLEIRFAFAKDLRTKLAELLSVDSIAFVTDHVLGVREPRVALGALGRFL